MSKQPTRGKKKVVVKRRQIRALGEAQTEEVAGGFTRPTNATQDQCPQAR